MRIKLRDIYIGDRSRRDYGTKEMKELQDSMSENGQITPITVRPTHEHDRTEEDYEGQTWALVAGGRRLNAAWTLGWEDIEGYAREEMSMLVSKSLELHENLARKDMTWQEVVDAKAELARLRRMENPEITDREIAQELGESIATFSRDLKTAQLIQENPGLRKAGSKHSALNAGKVLEDAALRSNRAAVQNSPAATAAIGPLENRIVTSDAQSFVAALPTASIDLVLIDGPYGYNYWGAYGGRKVSAEQLSAYDDSPETVGPMYRQLVPELVRVARPTGWLVMFCGKETYDFLEELTQDCCAEHASYRHNQYPHQCERAVGGQVGECRFLKPEPFPWIWYRPNSRNNPRFPQHHAKNMAELILVVNLGKGRLLKQPCHSVLVHDADYTGRVHANQKPVPLYRDLIERFTFSGDSVLDCFFGSGNSLVATASLGRVPYGCDKNPGMLQFAHANVRANQQQVSAAMIAESHKRFAERLASPYADTPADEVDPDEKPAAASSRPIERRAKIDWEFEILPVEGKYIGYFRYDGHNLGQRHHTDLDALEMSMSQSLSTLKALETLGLLDPCSCTPEEAMAALTAAEAEE